MAVMADDEDLVLQAAGGDDLGRGRGRLVPEAPDHVEVLAIGGEPVADRVLGWSS